MHPALSIIVFTTLCGLGYGLAGALGLGLLDPAAMATRIAHVVALVLIAAGLLSSTFHLGNPQRAWRAISQWRSSWLSREGVMALITFIPLVISAGASVFYGRYLPIVGIIGTILCIVTVFCTAMIYASIRAVDAWNTRLTPASYLLLAAAGGTLFSAFFAAAGDQGHVFRLLVAIAFLIAAWAVRIRWRRHALGHRPSSTPESATGLGFIGRVRPFEPPHMMDNYLTREMGFRIARKHADKLFGIAILFGGAMPTLLAALLIVAGATQGLAASIVLFLALASFCVGIFIERWLFFAEARHAVMNYYRG